MESSHLFIAEIANIWQLLLPPLQREELSPQLEPAAVFNQGSYAGLKEQ